jgi:HEAT repeat protein
MIQQWMMDAECNNYESKTRAIAALGNVKAQEALDVLIEIAAAAEKRDNRPRWWAVRALGRIANPAAIPTLIGLLDHYNHDTALYARVALAEITGVYFGENKSEWQQWWDQNKEDSNF